MAYVLHLLEGQAWEARFGSEQ